MKSKFILSAIAALASSNIYAAPTLSADFYAPNAIDSVSCTINGANPITGVVDKVDPTKWIPKCDLAGITVTGTYTLVMTVTKVAGCVGNSCFAGGVASSTPFTYNWTAGNVITPKPKLEP